MDGTQPTSPSDGSPRPIPTPPWQDGFRPVMPGAMSTTQAFPSIPAASAPAPGAHATAPVRFAPLSSLPPDKRLPSKRVMPTEQSAQPAPAPTPVPAGPGIAPRQLPGVPDARALHKPVAIKNIGFNCPSCLAILTIKQPEQYDGQAAPCPNCGVVILPPRIAPPSPFTLLSAGQGQATGFPAPAQHRRIPAPNLPIAGLPAPAQSDQENQNLGSSKPGLPGATRLAKAALF
jgi:hypothetical protein